MRHNVTLARCVQYTWLNQYMVGVALALAQTKECGQMNT